MSEKGRGRSRGRAASTQRPQPQQAQQLPHAQPSTSQETRRPGQVATQVASSVSNTFYLYDSLFLT